MRMLVRSALLSLIAATTLAVAMGSASANVISVSTQQIRTILGPLKLRSNGVEIRCNVTLEGSLHSATFDKVLRSLLGYITRANLARPCTGGTSWVYNGSEVNEVLGGTLANSLPWHLVYRGFNGVLPIFARALFGIVGYRLRTRSPTILGTLLCDYTTTVEQPAPLNFEVEPGGIVTSASAEEGEAEIPSSSGGLCGAKRMSFSSGSVKVLGTTQSIRVKLT